MLNSTRQPLSRDPGRLNQGQDTWNLHHQAVYDARNPSARARGRTGLYAQSVYKPELSYIEVGALDTGFSRYLSGSFKRYRRIRCMQGCKCSSVETFHAHGTLYQSNSRTSRGRLRHG